MAVLSPPRVLGATGQQLSARLLRLTDGAKWRPSATPLGVVSGVVAGPAGSMGELTLVNPTTLNVNPFLAVIQGTHAADQGAYEVPNDALVVLPVTGQHASQFRRSLVLVEVNDSQALGVASTATTDRARLYIADGALSASAPGALPAVPANTLALGEIAIPPTGQTVTLTPYNPRTTSRGGILPVGATDTTPGTHLDQYRGHPTYGLQRWDGTAWGSPIGRWVDLVRSIPFGYSFVLTTTAQTVTSTSYNVTVPAGMTMELEFATPSWSCGVNTNAYVRMIIGGSVVKGAVVSTNASTTFVRPLTLAESVVGTGGVVAVSMQAWAATGSASITGDATSASPVVMRYRIS